MKLRLVVLSSLLAASLVLFGFRSRVQAVLYDVERVHILRGRPAPELPKGAHALDGKAVQLGALRGRVVMLHFFTFACSNCRRMAPELVALSSKYAPRGLATVGIHSPETDEERDVPKLRAFLAAEHVVTPVVQDLDYAIWDRFKVEAWPTVIVIDRRGQVVGTFVGDGQASAIDELLGSLL